MFKLTSVLVLVAVSSTLAGCQQATIRRAQQEAALDDQICTGYGVQPGTSPYVQCRIAREQNRTAANAVSDAVRMRNSENLMAIGLAMSRGY